MVKKKKHTLWFEEPLENAKKMGYDIEKKVADMWDKPLVFKFKLPEVSLSGLERSIPIKMAETDFDLLLRAELPGFSKEDVRLKVTPKSVSITAEKKRVRIEKTEKIFKQERSYGSLSRTISLPIEIKTEGIKAKMDDGVLKIIMPKKEIKKKEEKEVNVA